METGIVVGVMVLLALAGVCIWWIKHRGPTEEPVFHFRCPSCLRRLRYKAKQVGHKGQCSHCKAILTFPPVARSVEKGGRKGQAGAVHD
jgi:hypothetical protein